MVLMKTMAGRWSQSHRFVKFLPSTSTPEICGKVVSLSQSKIISESAFESVFHGIFVVAHMYKLSTRLPIEIYFQVWLTKGC